MIKNAFPNVQLVTSMIDPGLDKENAWIQPGIGNFGGKKNNKSKDDYFSKMANFCKKKDRYFGTEEEEYE